MLFDSSIRKELTRTLIATVIVVITIVLTIMLIRTLGKAASGEASAEDVIFLLIYVTLGFLPMILSLSLFIATIASFSRMYRDSEMVIWLASGAGLMRFVRPALQTALPVLLLLAASALIGRPWGQAKISELIERHQHRSDLSKVSPGEFQSSQDGRRVFYIDRKNIEDPSSNNVFIMSNEVASESIVTAKEGKIILEKDRRLLELNQGHRTTFNLENSKKTLAEFENGLVLINDPNYATPTLAAPRTMSSWQLLWDKEPRQQAELAWRIGLVFGGINLLLLGLGLARGGPRQTSNWNLLAGLLSFIIYYNAMNLVQSWSSSGKTPPMLTMLLLHSIFFLGSIFLFRWRLKI